MRIKLHKNYGNDFTTTHKGTIVRQEWTEYEKGSDHEIEHMIDSNIIMSEESKPEVKEESKPEVKEEPKAEEKSKLPGDKKAPITKDKESKEKSVGLTSENMYWLPQLLQL